MKKYIVHLFSLLLISNISFGQSGWYWVNPLYGGNTINQIKFNDQNTGFAVGKSGTIFKSTNSGLNWFMQNSNTTKDLFSFSFLDSIRGYVGSEYLTNGYTLMVKTSDGGLNWVPQNFFVNTGAPIYKIQFIDTITGFLLSSMVKKTTNGGFTWFEVLTSDVYQDFYFPTKDTGYVVGYPGLIRKTNNGGINWFSTPSGTTNRLYSVNFVNGSTGYAAGDSCTILKTTNGGNTWLQQFGHMISKIYSIAFYNEMLGCAVGENGIAYSTTNGGLNWSLSSQITNKDINTLSFANSSAVYAGCNFGEILRSSNSGLNWISLSSYVTDRNLSSLCFVNSLTGYCAGANGTILKTNNSGINWISMNPSLNIDLLSIDFPNSNTGFVTATNGIIEKTTNSGVNWNAIQTSVAYHLNSVKFLDESTGVSVGGYIAYNGYHYGGIIRTTNGGNNWNQTLSLYDIMYSIYFLDSSIGFVCGEGGLIYKTQNKGSSWYLSNSGIANSINITDLCFINHDTGFAAGFYLFKTTNGGMNWTQNTSLTNLYSLCRTDSTSIYAVGYSGSMYKSNNNGLSWSSQQSITSNRLFDVAFFNSNTGVSIGEGGTIIRTTNGGNPIGISPIDEQIPSSFALSQNYPNPFNPTTKIKFDVPKQSLVKIVIYDILGREVTTLVKEEMKPGTFEADWDASNFASGIYFYQLTAGDLSTGSAQSFVETKKMVLMK